MELAHDRIRLATPKESRDLPNSPNLVRRYFAALTGFWAFNGTSLTLQVTLADLVDKERQLLN
jgi:hypothetical protein